MIDKGTVIQTTLLRLGKNNQYNDNKSEEYIIAEQLLKIVLSKCATRTSFLFNAVTTKLTSIGKNELGENRFNIPVDNLNIIRAKEDYRQEGEFLYSPSSELHIQYCRNIEIEEYPASMFEYIVMALCKEMCLAYNSYFERLPYFMEEEKKETSKIIAQQGFNYKPWGDK